MRVLLDLPKRQPNAQSVMLGGDETSYGVRVPKGENLETDFY
jgi:hypothetical protein